MFKSFDPSRLLKVVKEDTKIISLNNRTDGYTFDEMKFIMKMSDKNILTFQMDIGLFNKFPMTQEDLENISIQLAKDIEQIFLNGNSKCGAYTNMLMIKTVEYSGNLQEYMALTNLAHVTDIWQTISFKITLFYDYIRRREHDFLIQEIIEKLCIQKTRQLPYNSPLRRIFKNNCLLIEYERLLLLYGLVELNKPYSVRTLNFYPVSTEPENTTDWSIV